MPAGANFFTRRASQRQVPAKLWPMAVHHAIVEAIGRPTRRTAFRLLLNIPPAV